MPHEDFSHKAKSYRIVWEEPTVSRPQSAKVIAVELLKPGHKVVFEQEGEKADIPYMTKAAHSAIEKL
jgi:hypothetical protein